MATALVEMITQIRGQTSKVQGMTTETQMLLWANPHAPRLHGSGAIAKLVSCSIAPLRLLLLERDCVHKVTAYDHLSPCLILCLIRYSSYLRFILKATELPSRSL